LINPSANSMYDVQNQGDNSLLLDGELADRLDVNLSLMKATLDTAPMHRTALRRGRPRELIGKLTESVQQRL
jgi:hypothetical protein